MAMPASETKAAAPKRTKTSIWLEPESGVEIIGGELHAVSAPVWLRIEPIELITRRAWVRLRYASGVFDDPVRPLIRFTLANGRVSIQAMNGPVLGTAEWVGRVPMNTVSVSISPGNRLGRIAFRIERF
ncbi:MAG TPA: hypothetical protein VHC71_04520, partial [Hyphomicrobium sp.]|nr:hypothetical protein [Hyphomicrobium sp.]